MPLGEKKMIARIRRSARGGAGLVAGIGDDCAVLRVPTGHELLVTTDFSLENIHFRRDWHPAELVGRRCLTRGLSDIAAMGGEPRAAFLSLALAADVPQKWVDGFFKGLLELAAEFGVPLAGGDTAQAGSGSGILADIAVVGSIPKGSAILRSGAKAGDSIYVTGKLGGAAAALAKLREKNKLKADFAEYLRPQARVAIGRDLRRRGLATAMIDLSDGLSTDLEHICYESEVGAEVEAEAIPQAEIGNKAVGLELALHGGDDYELLFSSGDRVPARIAGVRVTRIGRVVKSGGMWLITSAGKKQALVASGWEHFRP